MRREFCRTCGSTPFFDPQAYDSICIAMGRFDRGSETRTELHVFVAETGDYYDLVDGLPQHARLPVSQAEGPSA